MSQPEAESATGRSSRFVANTRDWLAETRPWRSPAVLLVVALNVVLIILYLWSRGGATTHIRIETSETTFRASVDGQPIGEIEFTASGEGGIAISLPGDQVPSLPGPSGIDSVRIADAATGDVILDEDFQGDVADTWSDVDGDWREESGLYATSREGFLTTGAFEWGNRVIDLEFKNPTIITVRVWRQEGQDVLLKIWPYRRFDSRISLVENSETIETVSGARLNLERSETIKSITAMMLRPYPITLAVIAGAIAVALLFRSEAFDRRLGVMGREILSTANGLVLIVAAAALALLIYILYFVSDAMPHVPDSVAYVFQAKIFASFHLTADPPPVEVNFSFFNPRFMHVVDGDWFSQYPFGHPLFLAIGERLGAVWLVPPVLGAASIYLIYRLGHHIYGTAAGLLAALLLFFSPFFQMTASNLMSHNTAVFVILMCLFLMVRPTKRRVPSMFAAGLFLGLLFNIRPLPAMALIPVLGTLLAYELWRAAGKRREVLEHDFAFAMGGFVMLLAYFAYNQVTTGVFTDSPQTLTFGETSNWVGFAGTHTVTTGLQNEQTLLSLMVLVADGWPAAIGFLFAALPFLLGTRDRWDYVLGAAFLSMAAANIFYANAAVMHGPRFWYETMPFLMLLSARGAVLLIERASRAGDRLAALAAWKPQASGSAVTGLAVFGLVAGLIASSAHGWMLEQRNLWPRIDFTPQRISALEGFNYTDDRLLDVADDMDIRNALVFVEPCSQWWCYGSVFWANSTGLNGDIVWARQTKTVTDVTLAELYPGRDLYLASYDDTQIRPTTLEELSDLVNKPESARGNE